MGCDKCKEWKNGRTVQLQTGPAPNKNRAETDVLEPVLQNQIRIIPDSDTTLVPNPAQAGGQCPSGQCYCNGRKDRWCDSSCCGKVLRTGPALSPAQGPAQCPPGQCYCNGREDRWCDSSCCGKVLSSARPTPTPCPPIPFYGPC